MKFDDIYAEDGRRGTLHFVVDSSFRYTRTAEGFAQQADAIVQDSLDLPGCNVRNTSWSLWYIVIVN